MPRLLKFLSEAILLLAIVWLLPVAILVLALPIVALIRIVMAAGGGR